MTILILVIVSVSCCLQVARMRRHRLAVKTAIADRRAAWAYRRSPAYTGYGPPPVTEPRSTSPGDSYDPGIAWSPVDTGGGYSTSSHSSGSSSCDTGSSSYSSGSDTGSSGGGDCGGGS